MAINITTQRGDIAFFRRIIFAGACDYTPPSPVIGSPKGALREGARGEGSDLPERARLVAQAFNEGDTIPTLMERHWVTMGTILDHLLKYMQAGNSLRKGADVEALSSAAPARW